jgi:hypothetical protein
LSGVTGGCAEDLGCCGEGQLGVGGGELVDLVDDEPRPLDRGLGVATQRELADLMQS